MNKSTQASFTLKGNMLPMTQLQLNTTDLGQIESQLKNTVEKTPEFFNYMPVVIDFKGIYGLDVDFNVLTEILKSAGFIPVGVSNIDQKQEQAANDAGLGIISSSKRSYEPEPQPKAQKANTSAKIISTPVRSGQQIYAQDTDLIIVSSVSPGAEVIADGNIHIYGTLRGRALAGVQGDINAQIFCQSLQAELVSIAGNYKLQDNFDHTDDGPVKVCLKQNSLIIEAL